MSKKLINQIMANLDDNKAIDINSLSLKGKSDIADYLIIATGTSSRHVSSLAQKTVDDLKKNNIKNINTEGLDKGDWVLIDGGDVIIHLFREEVRDFYDIEKLWSSSLSPQDLNHMQFPEESILNRNISSDPFETRESLLLMSL